jgi:hypothetical protein
MKPCIEFNTRKRQEAKTVFEQSLCKMSNNSTMENVRLRENVQKVSDKLKCKKFVVKPQLEQFRIINENTILIDKN